MNILFLADIVPYPPNTGIKIRTFNIIRQMSNFATIYLIAFNHRIMINSIEEMDRCTTALRKYCKKVEVFQIPSDRSKAHHLYSLARNLLQVRPYRAERYYSSQCVLRIRRIIKENKIDLIHLDKTEFYRYAPLFRGIPIVATNHNVESELMRERSHRETTLPRRLFAFTQYLKTRHYERKSLMKVDGYITTTDVDGDFFKRELGVPTPHRTIENGVDVRFYTPSGLTECHSVLIIGAQNRESTANFDATMFFIRQIWPMVIEQNPRLELWIVGRNPDPSIQELEAKHKGVKVYGFVKDEREFLERTKALLVPLRIGGGSRLKILTAMSMGKTIISTTKGAEGIACTHEKDIFIDDSPRDFASRILQVVDDARLRKIIGSEARKLVLRRYDWEIVGAQLREFYKAILNNARSDHL